MAPKCNGKIKALMHRLFEKAMLWDMIELERNPMTLVEVRGISKRRKKPFILSLTQYFALLDQFEEPYRTMVIVAQCTGLRVSEILALKWQDINFEVLTSRVTRKVVNGRVNRLKTEYSEDDLPLDPDFATQLLHWKRQCPSSLGECVFANPATSLPYYASEIQKDYLKPAGRRIGLESNGQPVNLSWHTFRHTYRSLLDATGAPIGVQQKLIAACAGIDHHGRIWQRADGFQTRGQQQSGKPTAQNSKGTGTVEAMKKAPSGQPLRKTSSQPLERLRIVGLCGVENP
jgi:integrase